MTVSRPAALRSVPPLDAEVASIPARTGRVVPFAPVARPRRRSEAGETRGEILLFLGVRYERLAS